MGGKSPTTVGKSSSPLRREICSCCRPEVRPECRPGMRPAKRPLWGVLPPPLMLPLPLLERAIVNQRGIAKRLVGQDSSIAVRLLIRQTVEISDSHVAKYRYNKDLASSGGTSPNLYYGGRPLRRTSRCYMNLLNVINLYCCCCLSEHPKPDLACCYCVDEFVLDVLLKSERK